MCKGTINFQQSVCRPERRFSTLVVKLAMPN